MPPNLLSVEHVPQQSDAGCLLACVQMVTRFLQREITQTELALLFEALPEGVPASRIKRLESQGFRVIYRPDGDLETLRHWLAQSIPPVVFLRTAGLEYWHIDTDHAAVIVGISEQSVYLHDPAFDEAPQVCSLGAFLYAWGEFEN